MLLWYKDKGERMEKNNRNRFRNACYAFLIILMLLCGIYAFYQVYKNSSLLIALFSQIPTLVGIYEALMFLLGKVNPEFRTRMGLITKGNTDVTLTNTGHLEVKSKEHFEKEVSKILEEKYSLDKFNRNSSESVECLFYIKNLPIKASIDFQEENEVLISFSQIHSTHKKVSNYYKNIDNVIRDIEKLDSVTSVHLTTRINYLNGVNIVLEELAKTKNKASIMVKDRYFTITQKDIEFRNDDTGQHSEILDQILTGQYFY